MNVNATSVKRIIQFLNVKTLLKFYHQKRITEIKNANLWWEGPIMLTNNSWKSQFQNGTIGLTELPDKKIIANLAATLL